MPKVSEVLVADLVAAAQELLARVRELSLSGDSEAASDQ